MIEDQSIRMEKKVAESQREVIRQIKEVGDQILEAGGARAAEAMMIEEGRMESKKEEEEKERKKQKPIRKLVLDEAAVAISTAEDGKGIIKKGASNGNKINEKLNSDSMSLR